MEFLEDYIVLVVLGICLCVGYILKHLVPNEGINRYIPLIMGVLGCALNIWINLSVSPEVLLAGLVSGLASTGTHQAISRLSETNV